jgi:dihydroorotate dehydrogenase subfamily 2
MVRPVLFRFDPEFVHDRFVSLGEFLGKFRITRLITSKLLEYNHPMLNQEIAGLTFGNPVGLAAGFDKNAKLINILPSIGFGHMELGSVTLHPYSGNPKPRLFRLKKSRGLVVYYGLMNDGVKSIAERVKHSIDKKSVIGISVAKTNSKDTATLEGGISDYINCLKYLEENNVGDYYTINISCPNTFGGEPFTTPERLEKLLDRIGEIDISKPVFIKMPINLPLDDFDSLLKICIKYKVTGVIIGNLTKVRDPELIADEIPSNIKGGISGKPTEELSNKLIAYTYKHYRDKLVIIGVGGIFSAQDAYKKIKCGASVVQLITGMIYQGPQLISQINSGIVKLLEIEGYPTLKEAIGKDVVSC